MKKIMKNKKGLLGFRRLAFRLVQEKTHVKRGHGGKKAREIIKMSLGFYSLR